MEEFIDKKIEVEYEPETGWKKPVNLIFDKKFHKVVKINSRWEEHTFGKPWWSRKHRVWYEIELDDGRECRIYWDRGASGAGQDWYLVKIISS